MQTISRLGSTVTMFAAIVGALLFFFVDVSSVHALTLSPARLEITAQPGQKIYAEIELFNEESIERQFFTSYENFEPSGEDGSPRFIGNNGGIATWMQADESFILKAGEKRTIVFSISVPEGTEQGGYFGAIFFGGNNPEVQGGSEVSVGGKLGSLVLLSIPGDTEDVAGVVDFRIETGRFASGLPLTFSYRVHNDGIDRIKPAGDIRVTNMFGMDTVTLSVNDLGGNVLPGSSRRFSSVWEGVEYGTGFFASVKEQWKNFHIGWYTAHGRIAWGNEGNVSLVRYDFLYVPWQLLLVSLGILGAFYGVLRRYNQWIISRSRSKG